MATKIGCFICTGCQIGQSVDIDALTTVAGEYNPLVCETSEAFCQEGGLKVIEEAITANELDGVVLAACSVRDQVQTFQFNGAIIDRVNLREGMAWTHKHGDEDTTMLAEDMIRMSFGKMQFCDLPAAETVEVHNRVMVIGGGVAGMSAALQAASRPTSATTRSPIGGGEFVRLAAPSTGRPLQKAAAGPNARARRLLSICRR